jgi:PhnB protein
MHMTFQVGDQTIMASDGQCQGAQTYQGFALSLTVKSEAEADKRFKALAEGGQVSQPLMKTFFSPRFGMVTDRFGVSWMIHAAP